MKRVYYHYEKWEDYQNGMYAVEGSEELIKKAVELLSNPVELKKTMKQATIDWPCSTEFNLTNTECNRKAWLGWAACCIQHKVPETLTRAAWGKLTDDQRIKANAVASQIIEEWEICYLNKKQNYAQTEFRF